MRFPRSLTTMILKDKGRSFSYEIIHGEISLKHPEMWLTNRIRDSKAENQFVAKFCIEKILVEM